MRSRTWRPRRVLALLLAPLIALMTLSLAPVAPASGVAGDIVVNGGFEVVSGTTYAPIYANWSYSGGIRTGGGYFASTYDIHTGSHAFFVMNPADVVLTQVLTTSPGTTYDLGFWHSSVIGTSLTAAVIQGATTTSLGSFAGTGYYGPVNPPYVEHTGLSFTATGTAVTLRFVLNDPGGFAGWLVALDDVSVVPQTSGPTVPEAPAAPTTVVVSAGQPAGVGRVDLSWAAPYDGGAAITGYTVEYRVSGTTTWQPRTTTTTSVSLSALLAGLSYEFRVLATNGVGDGLPSAVSTATPVTVPMPLWVAPTAVAGDGQVDLTWSAADGCGAEIIDYTIGYVTAGSTMVTTTSTTTSATITGLTNGTTYQFVVRARNSVGLGDWSAAATATPTALVTVPGAPGDLQAVQGAGNVYLSWSAPADGGAAITGYTVYYKAVAGSSWETTPSTLTWVTVMGLTNGTEYEFKVLASNSEGPGPFSTTVTATPSTYPGAPVAPIAVAGDGQVELSWSAPADDGGSPIIDYTIGIVESGSVVPYETSTTTSRTITGLTNGRTYEFVVLARNILGTGPWSQSAMVTPVASATVPGAPSNLQATPGNGQVGLTWSAPADDGGASISGYTVSYKAVSGSTWADVSAAGTSKTVTGLVNGTTYEFKVMATNSAGEGPYSSMVTATPVAPTFDVLEAIAHLRSDVVTLDLGKAETRLTVLLDNAVKDVQQGNVSEAAVKVDSFIDKVEAMTGGKKAKDLTTSEADHLIQHAEVITLALTS